MTAEELIEMLMSGGLTRPPGVDEQPEVSIACWDIMEISLRGVKTHHVVGYMDGGGRVSSAIQSFDPEKRQVITNSGRVYYLAPEGSGSIQDIEYTRGAWLRMNGVREFTDVTPEYREKMK